MGKRGGGSLSPMASRIVICGRKEGSLVQHGSVVSAGSNFGCLTPSSLFWAYLGTTQFGEIFSGDS